MTFEADRAADAVCSGGRLGAKCAARFCGELPADLDLAQYVGQYRDISDPDQVHVVYLEGGALYEESERRERQKLTPDNTPETADRFRIESPKAHVVFVRDAAGAISGLKLVLDRDGHTLAEEKRFSAAATRLNHYREYKRQEAMLPMRDGVRLHAVILRPAHVEAGEALPFLMYRTPYGVDEFDSQSVNQDKPELSSSGYIFVYQDIRGRYKSEGQFVMNRPIVPHSGKSDVDETTDTHDTIDWLLKNVPGNNGRVGVAGVSYDGFLAMMAGIDVHPAVKAISPQAPMTDVWMGDDFFHNGAFRETYGFDYVQQMEAQKTDARVDAKQDNYDFFLQHGNFAGAAAAAKMTNLPHPPAAAAAAPPRFWRRRSSRNLLTQHSGRIWRWRIVWQTCGCPHSRSAAIGIRRTCGGRRRNTPRSRNMIPAMKSFSRWDHGTTAVGKARPASWDQTSAGWTSASRPGASFAKRWSFPSSKNI